MPRDLPTPVQSPAQVADLYEQQRRIQVALNEGIQLIVCTSTTRPTSPGVGQPIYELDTSSFLTWDGYGWRPPWNLPWGRVADVKISAQVLGLGSLGVPQDLPGLTVGWVATQGRRYGISALVPIGKHVSTSWTVVGLFTGDGAQLAQAAMNLDDNGSGTASLSGFEYVATTSGPITMKLVGNTQGGTYDIQVTVGSPAWLHVDDIGPGIAQAAPTPRSIPSPPPTGALGVVVTNPLASSQLPTGTAVTVTAAAQAATGKTITQVEFFADGALIAADTSSPYQATWTPTTAGPHSVTAKVTQSDAAVVVSAPVAVTVVVGTGGGTGGGGTGGGGTGTGTAPPKLVVTGLALKDPSGVSVVLRGWNQYVVPAFADPTAMTPLTTWFDTHLDQVAADWQARGVNCVRMPVMRDVNASYAQRVATAVATLGARGMYVILTPDDAQTFGAWPSSTPAGTGTGAGAAPTFGRSLTTGNFSGATWSPTDATSYPFTVTTPTAGRTVFATVVTHQAGGTAVTPTVAGLGLAWVQRGTVSKTHGSNTIRTTVFSGTGTPSGTTFTVTASTTQLGCGIQLSEFNNVDPTTPVSFVTTGSGTAVAASINLSSTPTSGMVYAAFGRELQEGTASIGTGWTRIDGDWGTTPDDAHITMFNTANAANATATFFTSDDWAGVALQINGTAAPATGGSGTPNDDAVTTAAFMLNLWTACGKPGHLMLEAWSEPVGTVLTQAQWQSGMQAALGVYRAAGPTMYDGPVFMTARNWGWSFDAAEATAIRVADSNVVFCTHRAAVATGSASPLPTTDPASVWKPIADAAAAAGCAMLMASYAIYNGGFGTGGTATSNAQGWGAAMAQAIQDEVAAGKCVGGLGWMWTWGGMNPGEDSENAGVTPTWPGIVAGQTWAYDAWGQVVTGMIGTLATGVTTPTAGAPTVSLAVASTALVGASVPMTATATAGTGSITKVDFYVDNVLLSTDSLTPFTATWTAVAGQHVLRATATQSDGQTAATTQTVVVATAGTVPLNGFQAERAGAAFIDMNGAPLIMRGVAQYLVEYSAAGSGAGTLYTWFTNHIDAVAADWQQKGANICRIMLKNDTTAGYINDLKAKVQSLWAHGIYSMICAFDGGSFGAYNSNTGPDSMYAIWHALGDLPYCFIETNNEPNSITAAQWQTGMDNWRSRLRAAGYKGIIFMGARDWSWTADLTQFQALLTNDVAVGGSKPGNLCFINHRYAVTDPANAVQPANDGTATWKPQWPDTIGAAGVCFMTNEWGPWNGGTAAQFGIGGSYNGNVDGWGENMRQEIQNAVQAGHMGGATGWMWAWSDPNGMTGPDAPTSTSYVEGTTAAPWTLNRWGQKMWSLVATLGGTPTLPGAPSGTVSTPSTAQTGNVVTITATATAGSSAVTIAKVDLLIDASIIATDTVAPYSFSYTAATGTHSVAVKVTQSDGQTFTTANQTLVVTTTTPPSGGAGLLHVSGKLIKDASSNTVFLRGLNQYIVTPYFNNGTDYLFSWFDSHIAQVATDWFNQGVRCVRMPINCADSSTAYFDFVKRTVQTIIGKGIYVVLTGFGGLGSYPSNAGNIATYLASLYTYCGKPAMCMINLWNEPNEGGSLSNAGWLSATQTARSNLRSGGYTGIIFFDANIWATVYDSSSFNTLLSNDSALGGNICFSTHRYHALCGSGYLASNWPSSTSMGGWIAGGVTQCIVVGEYGWFNCYGDFAGGGQAFCNDATDTIIAGKSAGNLAGAWAWMWTWDENSLVDPSQYNITQGNAWSYNGWGQIAKRMWANTAQGV